MKKVLKYIIAFAVCTAGMAQQPQSQTAPLFAVNAKYVNGVAPGYQVLAGNGLTLSLGPGTSFCNGVIQQFAGATINLTASTTNNIYLNTTSSCSPSVKLTAFTATDIPIAQVVTGTSTITTITDLRTMFVTPTQATGVTSFSQLTGNLGVAQGPTGLTGIVKDTAGTLTVATPNVDYATPNQNTTGTAANLTGAAALPNGTTATTQATSDNTQKLATDAFVQTAVQGATGHPSAGAVGAVQVAAANGAFGDSGCTNPITQNLTCASFSTIGSGGGGFDYTEGSAQTANTGHDITQANATTHEFELSNNGDAFARVLRSSDTTIACIPNAFASQTDGATVTWAIGSAACSNGYLTFTTHGGSRTLNVTGVVDGGSYVLYLQQDATGGEGLVLGTGCTWKVSNGGSGAITTSTGANAVDVLAFTVKGTTCLANFTKNFN